MDEPLSPYSSPKSPLMARRKSSLASMLGIARRKTARPFVRLALFVNFILWAGTIFILFFRTHAKGPDHAPVNPFRRNYGSWLQSSRFQQQQEPDPPLKCNQAAVGEHLPFGKHYLVDMFDVDSEALQILETSEAEELVAGFIRKAGMTLLGTRAHRFPCGGITAVWLLSESHVSIHTWPENQFIALDVYTCGAGDPSGIVQSFRQFLKPERMVKTFVNRGSRHQVSTKEATVSEHDLLVEQEPAPVSSPPQRKRERLPTHIFKAPPAPEQPAEIDDVDSLPLGQQRDYTISKGKNLDGNHVADICINADDLDDDCIMLRNTTLLADVSSAFQRIEVVDTQNWGRCMLLDRVVQYCENDNDIYTTELITRALNTFDTGAMAIGEIRNKIAVQLIGGGDGWVPSAILDRYSHLVANISAVDIDPLVTELTRKHFQPVGKVDAFTDRRVQWTFADAGHWVKSQGPTQSADIVIVDCTDHTADAAKILYTQEFYRELLRMLKPGGVIVQQMNTDSESYKQFFLDAEEVWTGAGFRNLQKWKRYIPSFLGESVFWMASRTH